MLLEVGTSDRARVTSAVERIVRDTDVDVRSRLAAPLPLPIERGLSHADALLGQFELICCDCISVFVCDTVLAAASKPYLTELFTHCASREFDLVAGRLESVPLGPTGLAFLNRFFGRMHVDLPLEFPVMRKKARSMSLAAEGLELGSSSRVNK